MEEFPRISRLPPYVFNVTGELKLTARRHGEDVIDFSMGNPDQPTPSHIVEKLIETVRRPDTHGYSVSKGIPRLRRAICNWYQRRYAVELDPDSEAIVTIGSKEGIAHLALATLDRGDIVLVPNPSYPIHIYGPVIAGADIHHVPMHAGVDFFEALETAIRDTYPKPKMLIVNFPSNPTTQCVDLAFFERLVGIAREHHIYVVHDLAYADIVFDGYKAPSIMQVPGARDIAVEFFTMSKSYNMAGWRVGYMVGNRELVTALARMKSYHDYGTFTPIQVASIIALEGPQECVEQVRACYQARRDVLCSGLHAAGWKVPVPKASMYVWAPIPEQYKALGSLEFSKKLLADAKIAVAPGTGFGHYGDGHVRFAMIENEGVYETGGTGDKGNVSQRRIVMKPINVGLLGIGTVGGGAFTVLKRNQEEIGRRAGSAITMKMVADKDLEKLRGIVGERAVITADALEVVNNKDIDIVVELIGGTSIARELVLKAIANGKHVVTANKALLAQHGNDIFAAAQKNNVMVAFEGAVGGGIPIIKSLREGLTANRIEWIAGIINGTSNFILSEMREKGAAFKDVLKEAQRLGYAETDPTFDIEGVDAAHKLTIMAAIGFGIPMQFGSAYIEGISKLTREDIRYAEELGYRIKLLGIAKRKEKGIELRVHPTLIPARRLIANVEGVMNAILVKGDAVGQTMYYGAGAGAEPTASAVVADLVDVARMMTADPEHRVPHLAFQPDRLSDVPILPISEVETAYYFRMRVYDKRGALADITRLLADSQISIDAMVQKEPQEGEKQVDIVMLTHLTVEKNVDVALAKIEKLPVVAGKVTRIRLEQLD